ncbi:MAG: AAA family ATPase, partial [Anaerolineae bacterium]|nr:AAA family ATPase [Anaerolineae bacterium]
MEASAYSRFVTYVTECARILYWSYFKPFTFRSWLREIAPDLDMDDNPFKRRADFDGNPRLRRYANQAWWLAAAVPLLAVLLVGPAYSLLAPLLAAESFDWSLSLRFLLGWWVGLWLARGSRGGGLEQWATRFLLIVFGLTLLFGGLFQFAPSLLERLLAFLPAPAWDLLRTWLPRLVAWWPVAVGVAGGVAFGVAFGVAVGVAGGVA